MTGTEMETDDPEKSDETAVLEILTLDDFPCERN